MPVNTDVAAARRQFIRAQRPEEIYQALVSATHQYLECMDCRIATVENDILIPEASATTTVDPDRSAPLSSSIAGQVFMNQQASIINNISFTRSAASDASNQLIPDKPSTQQSVLCVPIGEYGVLQAIANEPAAFTETQLEHIETLVADSVITLDRIHDSKTDTEDARLTLDQMLIHELRNLLTISQGHLTLAQDECASEHLNKVATAFERIEEILTNADILVHHQTPPDERQTIDLAEVAKQCWTIVATKDATLQLDGPPRIQANPQQLRHLFENLFRNAVDHAGPDVTVRVGSLEEETGWYVADDGPGIPASEHATIFEPGYSQADRGTGLGLAIVASIVEANGWKITVSESKTGGARFDIRNVDIL